MSVGIENRSAKIDVQDSPLRRLTARPLRQLAKKIHEKLPSLSANEVSVLGFVLALTGGYVTEREKRKSDPNKITVSAAVALLATGLALDALDGPIAKEGAKDGKIKVSKIKGDIVDISADRGEEIGLALMRAKTASLSGNRLGELTAFAVAVTATLPNLASQAKMAVTRESVPEVGTNPLTIPGTRPGRVAAILTGNLLPIFGQESSNGAQTAIDYTVAAGNVYAVINRMSAKGDPIDEKTRQMAARKTAANLVIETGAIGITIYNTIRKHRRIKIK